MDAGKSKGKEDYLKKCENCDIFKEFGECDLGCEVLDRFLGSSPKKPSL
jgi:hypothetical protein